ncbi:MAG TPA: class I SAM-dependent methyltransferase [Kofleriaceae bacterium]|jgi:methylase of polypeptide subunit release factors|nr:class I SAM-dependent methyltransferase [Kofleriaceae bacterium]
MTRRLLRAWAGTDRISALRADKLAALPITKASAELALFVAGVDVPASLGDFPLAERRGDHWHAAVAILPTARGAIVCDRHDAPADDPERVCWPDDSSYHLARSIPLGKRASWLDVGCGSAFAMAERPEAAERRVGIDVNPRAAAYAKRHADVRCADATSFDPGETFELVTCNPPIPGGDGPIWRGASAETVRAMIATAGRLVAPTGLAIVHAALEALTDLRGDATIVVYTPAGERAFGVAWWQPAGQTRQIIARRALSTERPHIDWTDRDAALAGAL